jgi:hypothetical protein
MSDEQRPEGVERRQDYKDVNLTIDERVSFVEQCVRRWIIRGIIGFAIIGITSTLAIAGYGYILREQHEAALELCKNANIRHDNAITALKVGSDLDQKNAPNEAARAEIRRRRDVTIGIINGISPKIDCENPKPVKRLELPK